MNTSPGGSFLSGLADGWNEGQDRKNRAQALKDAQEARLYDRAHPNMGVGNNNGGYEGGSGGTDAPSGRGGSYRGPTISNDPVNTTLSPTQRAFLNAVAGGESGGAYDVRYGGKNGPQTFDVNAGLHPRVYEATADGKRSSAAGRYEFTATTWDDVAGRNTPFTRENQDQYAWKLASDRYHATTKRDLASDLDQHGFTPQIASALAPTWESFNGQYARHAADYQSSLDRYRGTAPDTTGVVAAPRQIAAPTPAAPTAGLSFGLATPPLVVQPQQTALSY